MAKFRLIIFVTSLWAIAVGQQDYGELPTAALTSSNLQLETSSLQPLFDMAKNFVDIVFVPFSTLTVLFTQLIQSNPLTYLQSNWQTFLNQQAGLIACLVFGVLFIALTLIGGILMCCCRCCCNKCGGQMKQSRKRAKSRWRTGYCVGLFLCTVMIFAPAALVLLTNEWVETVVKELPTQTSNVLQNGVTYVDLVDSQLQHFITQFNVFAGLMREEVSNVDQALGPPIIGEINAVQQSTLSKLTTLSQRVTNSQTQLNTYEQQRGIATTNHGTYRTEVLRIVNEATASTALSVQQCTLSNNCNAARTIIAQLNAGDDLSQLRDQSSELTNLNNYVTSCQNVYASAQSSAEQTVTNSVNSALSTTFVSDLVSDVDNQLGLAQNTILSTINDLNVLSQIRSYFVNARNSISQLFIDYKDNFDFYRWVAGVVLGSFLILICALYFFGSFFGYCCGSVDTPPSERSSCSNFSGILVMSGVGLSFLFAWLFMILVIFAFIFGGAMERYVCQTAQSPYELLRFIDQYNPLNFSTPTTQVNSNLQGLVTSCQNNAGLLQAFGLTNVVNFDEIEQSIDQSLQASDINLNVVLTNDPLDEAAITNCFDEFAHTATTPQSFSTPNFTAQIQELRGNLSGIPTNLQIYVSTAISDLETVQSGNIATASSALVALQTARNSYNSEATAIGTLKNELRTEIGQTNTAVTNAIPAIVSDQITVFVNGTQTIGNDFFVWFFEQMTNNLGACLPLYRLYDDFIVLICNYLINTLNGFWFSLGWAVFFMAPAAIFGLKLAKFFRRMDRGVSGPSEPTGIELIDSKSQAQTEKQKLNGGPKKLNGLRLPPIAQSKNKAAAKSNKVAPALNF